MPADVRVGGIGEAAKRLADTRYTYDAYLQRTREACAALASVEARPIVEGRVA